MKEQIRRQRDLPEKLLRPRMPIFILWKKMYGWKCCVIEMMPHIFIMKKQHSNWLKKILHQYIGVFVSLEQQIRARYGDEVLEQL